MTQISIYIYLEKFNKRELMVSVKEIPPLKAKIVSIDDNERPNLVIFKCRKRKIAWRAKQTMAKGQNILQEI